VPLTKTFQIVPFYDGGNVFRRIGDIFGRNDRRPGDTINTRNLRVQWTHTVGLGLRVRTPRRRARHRLRLPRQPAGV
jgi:hypothetical protein